jgi:WhiB family transcriptional regulator, redox-sensing transcriptional regulator
VATSTIDVCEACDLELEPERRPGPRRRYCCEACRKFAGRNPGAKRPPRPRPCARCRVPLPDGWTAPWCSKMCRDRHERAAGTKPGRQVYSEQVRGQALELAAEYGAADAGRRLGVLPVTVRAWLHQAGRRAAPDAPRARTPHTIARRRQRAPEPPAPAPEPEPAAEVEQPPPARTVPAGTVEPRRRQLEPLDRPPLDVEGWQANATCADPDIDPDIFFPGKGQPARDALEVCARCPVRADCLEHALKIADDAEGMHFGIFGGMTPNQRRHLVRGHRSTAA